MSSTPVEYISLAKPRICLMVGVATFIGFFLASTDQVNWMLLLYTLIGTVMSGAGSATLNSFLEREYDAQMNRTKNRALPRGVIAPENALVFGIVLVLGGVSLLVWKVNLLTGFLGLLTAFLYVLVYTPLKRVTWMNTFVGAVPGALPPMGGWAAASGEIGLGAWILFLILFIWQHPHFYAIAWMYRDDYRVAGFQMLPVVDTTGVRTCRQIIGYSALLIGVSFLPVTAGISGMIYAYGAVALGVLMFLAGVAFTRQYSYASARRLLHASLIYLPLLLVFVVTDAIALS